MYRMWLLALILVGGMQLPVNPNTPGSMLPVIVGIPKEGMNLALRLNGRVVTKSGNVPQLTISLRNEAGLVVRQTNTFADGSFRMDGVNTGFYWIEIFDPRFERLYINLQLRQPADFEKAVVLELVPAGAARTPYGPETVEAIIARVESDNTISPNALDHFRKGLFAAGGKTPGDTAEQEFRQAVTIHPGFYEAHYRLGIEQARNHKTDDATRSFERANELDPAATAPLRSLAMLYGEIGNFQKAAETVLRIAPREPLTSDDRYHLGDAFYRLDQSAAAQQQFEAAIAMAPGRNPKAYVQLYNARIKNGDSPGALKALDDYLRLFPDDPNHKTLDGVAKSLRQALKKPGFASR